MRDFLETCRGMQIGSYVDKTFSPPDTPAHYARDRVFGLQHLKLDLTVDDEARTVAGVATLRLAPINDGLREIVLDQQDLDIQKVSDDAGRALEWKAYGEELSVRLPKARKAGEAFELRVKYACRPRKGLYFTAPDKGYPKLPRVVWTQGEEMDNRSWFPSYDYPNQRFTSEIVVTVKDAYRAVANGHLVSEKHDAKKRTRTFHWLQDKPHPNYLIALVVGEWDTKEWDADGVPVQAYVPKGYGKYIDLCFSRVPAMVKYFGRVTGRTFPWDKYAQVCVPEFTFGGMENTSITILTEYCLTDEKAYPDYSSDTLLAHELAHQWFGDWITTKSWGHLWLNESFADYFECLWWEDYYGGDEFIAHLEDVRKGYYEEAEKRYKRAIATPRFVDPEDMLDAHTDNKGCGVLHMIRTVLGNAQRRKAIRHYEKKHALANVETADFKIAIEEATGRNLDWFFDEWLLKPGHPELEVSWSYDEKAKQVELRVRQTQKTEGDVPIFRMPVTLEILTGDRSTRETVQLEKAEHTFRIPARERPTAVLFDPDGALLKKLTFQRGKEELLWLVAHAKGAWARTEACGDLAKLLGDGQAIAALEKVLMKDKFWAVRAAAAAALGEVGSAAGREALLGSLKGQDSRVRRAIYGALGKFHRDEEAFQALAKAYAEEEKYHPMAAAGAALGASKHPKVFETIVKGMDRTSQGEVISRQASGGLATLRDERGIAALTERTRYGEPEMRRLGAAVALGKLGQFFENRRDDVMDHLVDLTVDRNYRTKLGAVQGLAELGYPKAVGSLEKVREGEILGMLKHQARLAITRIRETQAEGAKRSEQQESIDKLTDENRELKQRLTVLESKVDAVTKRRK